MADLKMLSIGKQSSPSNHSLRVVEEHRLIAQRLRVKPDEKLISKTADPSKPQYPSSPAVSSLCDLSTDFDFNINSNNADLVDLGNSQMSSFFREFNESRETCKEEKKISNANYKTVKGKGFYLCDLCPFVCLNYNLFLEHNEKSHHVYHSPLKPTLKAKCIACDNLFYSVNVLRLHLIEDHLVLSDEVDKLTQLSIEVNYAKDVSQIEDISLTEFNKINDTIQNSSEFDQNSHVIDNQTQITGENNFIDDCQTNEISNGLWDYQKQDFNEIQESNSDNDNFVMIKHIRCNVAACKVLFISEDIANYHIKFHLNDEFCCIELDCQHTEKKWSSMMTHLWKTHGIDAEMFSCNQCGFKTNSQYKLNAFHKSIHKQEKPFVCPECNKGFKSIKQLRNHRVIHKKKEKPLRSDLLCMHCSRNFSTKTLLHQHITTIHIRARPYACQECSYTTAVAGSLKLHMRKHTGEKPFKCEECGYSTADHNSLRKHKMRHSGKKNYSCQLCNYSCIQVSSYKKHLRTKHPGMDDGFLYSCDMCNFKTIRKDIHTLHIVKHKEEYNNMKQKHSMCKPIVDLDEIFNEKEKIQAEIAEQSYLFNTIRVKSLDTMKSN